MPIARRRALIATAALAVPLQAAAAASPSPAPGADRRWYDAADGLKRQAEQAGDQPYGAVVVLHGRLVGEGPSRVVQRQDPSAHAEREAIRDAQRRLGRSRIAGALLYSTSRPCSLCEAAAAEAGIVRMIFGPSLFDGGVPGLAPR